MEGKVRGPNRSRATVPTVPSPWPSGTQASNWDLSLQITSNKLGSGRPDYKHQIGTCPSRSQATNWDLPLRTTSIKLGPVPPDHKQQIGAWASGLQA
jgi:hypothetical protein